MMKPRSNRAVGDQAAAASRNKAETLANGAANQQTTAQAIRKRRSSINVYDQPSSLNSRLRQLETDMLRLDEDRTKLFDDTHSALAQYELKLSEIHAILKSRQDNVEKYVEDMRLLLQAKEDFEKQTKLLNDKHDRIHEKFMHRETIISREIKLLKNKFEILEKNRQFRGMLQKSNSNNAMTAASDSNANDDLISGLEGSSNEFQTRKRSETTTIQTGEMDLFADKGRLSSSIGGEHGLMPKGATKSVRINMSKLGNLGQFLGPLFGSRRRKSSSRSGRRKSNKISSISELPPATTTGLAVTGSASETVVASNGSDNKQDGAPPGFHLEPTTAIGLATELGTAPGERNNNSNNSSRDVKKRSTFLNRFFG